MSSKEIFIADGIAFVADNTRTSDVPTTTNDNSTPKFRKYIGSVDGPTVYCPPIVPRCTFNVKILDESVRSYYESIELKDTKDAALTIALPDNADFTYYPPEEGQFVNPKNFGRKIPLGIAVECYSSYDEDKSIPCLLMERSSTAILYPNIQLTGSLGLIDREYRGELAAIVNIYYDTEVLHNLNGRKLFQLLPLPSRCPTYVRSHITNELTETERGDKGFGSTGK